MSNYLGDFAEDYPTLNFKFTTRTVAGVPATLTNGVVKVYKANATDTEINTGLTLTADFDTVTGLNNVLLDLSAAAFYAVANDYAIVVTAGTVDGVSVVGEVLATFSIENRFVETDVTKWAGTAVHAASVAGIPVVMLHASDGGAGVNAPLNFQSLSISETTGLVTFANTSIATVTTVTNQLTAAAIATGVWQDATGADFTTDSSIGKSLFTGNVVPGGAGGMFIAGTNAALTITGAVSFGSTFGIAGATTFQDLFVTGDTVVQGVEIQGDLSVAGTTTFTGAVAMPAGLAADITGNITGTLATVTTLTNLPAIPNDWLAAAGVKADAVTKIQAGLATPTNITAAAGISLAASQHVIVDSGTVTTLTGHTAQTGDSYLIVSSGTFGNAAINTQIGTIATILSGITSLANWLRGIFNKRAMDATAQTEIRDTTGTFDPTTDSAEALRDRGDAAWVTATSVAVSDKTGFKLASDGLAAVTAWTCTITGNLIGTVSTVTTLSTWEKMGYALSATGADLVLKTSTFALALADAVMDEPLAGHTTAGTVGKTLNNVPDRGAGSTAITYTVTVGGVATSGVYCKMFTNAAGTGSPVSADTTNSLGQVVFYHNLPSLTAVYIFRSKDGLTFTNPDSEIIP